MPDLSFIIKMNDQASAMLKQFFSNMGAGVSPIQAVTNATKAQTQAVNENVNAQKTHTSATQESGRAADNAAGAHQRGASAHNAHASSAKEAAKAQSELIDKLKEAASATAELAVGTEISTEAMKAYAVGQKWLWEISRSADMAGESIKTFREQLEALNSVQGEATTNELRSIAQAASRMNVASSQIVGFSEDILKLGLNAEGMGAKYATAMAQVLNQTDHSTENAHQFANEIAAVSNTLHVSTDTLMNESQALSILTGNYAISKEELLGLGEVMRTIPGRTRTLMNALTQVFESFKTNTAQTDLATRELANSTGMTVAQIQALKSSHPEQVYELILSEVNKLNSEKINPDNFLTNLGIQGRETLTVIKDVAPKLAELQSAINAARNPVGDSLDELAKRMQAFLGVEMAMNRLHNAIEAVYDALGEAMAPGVTDAINLISSGLQGLVGWFKELPEPIREGIAYVASFGTTLLGLLTTISLVLPLIRAGVVASLASLGAAVGGILAAVTSPVAIIIAAVSAAGLALYELYQYYEEISGKMAGNTGSGTQVHLVGDMPHLGPKKSDSSAASAEKSKEVSSLEAATNALKGSRDAAEGAGTSFTSMGEKAVSAATDTLLAWNKSNKELQDLKTTLAAVSPGGESSVGFTPDEIARGQMIVTLHERMVHPIENEIRLGNLALDAARATTSDLQLQVQIRDALNAAYEKDATLANSDATRQALMNTMIEKASVLRNNALQTLNLGLDEQIAKQVTIGQQAQDELDVQIKLAAFRREHGDGADTSGYEQRIRTSQQLGNAQSVVNAYLPQVAAAKQLKDSQDQINRAQQAGLITLQESQSAMQKLNYETLGQVSPLGLIVRSSQQEAASAALVGPYREQEAAALKTIIDLKAQGLLLDQQQEAAMKTALTTLNEDLADLQKMNTTGFNGFVNSVGTAIDQLGKAESSFAEGLSGAIVGALEGQRGAFIQAGEAMGKAMLTQGVNAVLAQALKFTGLAGPNPAQEAKVKADQDKLQQIATAQMTINSANVTINGVAANALAGKSGTDVANPGAPYAGGTPGNAPVSGATEMPGVSVAAPATTSQQTPAQIMSDAIAPRAASAPVPTRDIVSESQVPPEPAPIPGTVGSGVRAPVAASIAAPAASAPVATAMGNLPSKPAGSGNTGDLIYDVMNPGTGQDALNAAMLRNHPGLNLGQDRGIHIGTSAATGHIEGQPYTAAEIAGFNAKAAELAKTAPDVVGIPQVGGASDAITAASTAQNAALPLGEKALTMAVPGSGSAVAGFNELSKLWTMPNGIGSLLGGAGSTAATTASTVAAGSTGLFPGLASLFSFLHSGGVVGESGGIFRMVNPAIFASAQRYHDGLGDDEFPAVLQRGERVLTASQDQRNAMVMSRLADAVANTSTPAGSSRPMVPGGRNNMTMIVNTPNASSFRSSSSQVQAAMHAGMQRMATKHN